MRMPSVLALAHPDIVANNNHKTSIKQDKQSATKFLSAEKQRPAVCDEIDKKHRQNKVAVQSSKISQIQTLQNEHCQPPVRKITPVPMDLAITEKLRTKSTEKNVCLMKFIHIYYV